MVVGKILNTGGTVDLFGMAAAVDESEDSKTVVDPGAVITGHPCGGILQQELSSFPSSINGPSFIAVCGKRHRHTAATCLCARVCRVRTMDFLVHLAGTASLTCHHKILQLKYKAARDGKIAGRRDQDQDTGIKIPGLLHEGGLDRGKWHRRHFQAP
jgi:hypothetical protein